MPDITKGKTFSSGDTVTAADLNSLLDDAVINNNAITNSKISDGAVDNLAVSGTAEIDFSKLASLSTGQVLAGNEGTPTATTLSGDVTIAADGAVTIADDAINTAKISNGAVDGAAIAMGSDAQGDILYHNGTSYVRLGAGTDGEFLKTQGAGANPVWATPVDTDTNTTISQIAFFTSGSSQTWTVPSGVTRIKVSAVGGGGGGSGSGWEYGGGGGAYFEKVIDVTSGTDVTYTVGSGSSGTGQSQAAAGGSTTVIYNSVTYTAGGGGGGGGSAGGSGGTATGGDINLSGVDGTRSGAMPGGNCGYQGFGGGGDGSSSGGENGESGFVKIEY